MNRGGRWRADGDDGRDAPPGVARNMAGSNRDGAGGGYGWPLAKSLCGVPTLFAWSLAYGMNLLTGEPSPAGRWMIRNVVVWARPNPAVGDLGDKFRPATSYLTVATKAKDRYFDLDAVRLPNVSKSTQKLGAVDSRERARAAVGLSSGNGFTGVNEAGTPPLDWWEPWPIEQALWDWWESEVWKIPTRPYAGSHYAVWPPALCVRPIKAMCPEKVCRTCGQPSRRIVAKTPEYEAFRQRKNAGESAVTDYTANVGNRAQGFDHRDDSGARGALYETLGWSDCGHDAWRPGMVLDPFAGSGTTLAVATGHGRDAIGIDLDERNADLVRERVGMFLTEIVEPLLDVSPRPVAETVTADGFL